MQDESDMHFDVDALFDHLTKNLGHELENEKEWQFSMESTDIETLETIGVQLQDEFVVQLQDVVEVHDIDGNVTEGPPILIISRTEAMTAPEVKVLAARFKALAEEHGVTYRGVTCFDPIDEAELFGLLKLDDAVWRLRHYTDCGLEENAELPWSFVVIADTPEKAKTVATALEERKIPVVACEEEPDEEGYCAVVVTMQGRNNESEVADAYRKIEAIAEEFGTELEGMQFME